MSRVKTCALFLFLAFSVIAVSVRAEEPPLCPKDKFRIAIFKEEGFPASGTPSSLSPEWIRANLANDLSVVYLNASELSDRVHLNTANFDFLILPYGEAFPLKAFPALKEYIYSGGGFVNLAGRPFWVAMDKINGRWRRLPVGDPYKEFLSPLGIKYYDSADSNDIGLSVTTSIGLSPVQPTKGNIFPYRIPARDFFRLETGIPGLANKEPLLVKSWINPYLGRLGSIPRKWCLVGAIGNKHPLNPKEPHAQEMLSRIMRYLSFPVVIYGLETEFAGYYPGEKVSVSLKIVNSAKRPEAAEVDFELWDEKENMVEKMAQPVKLMPQQGLTLSAIWQLKTTRAGFYRVRAILKKDGMSLDKEENGFVVIGKDILGAGPSLSISGDKFIINGKDSYLLGVNYYESRLGELMWLRPNLLRVRQDFQRMRSLGINFIRIHYHHPKWFRDYYAQVIKNDPDHYFQSADNTAMPSERSWRILDAIIQLAQREGLVFCMDIFSLVPEEMGEPRGWLGMKERIIDRQKILRQKEFIGLLAARYKDVPGITWDLWNEPRLENDDLGLLRSWANEVKCALRAGGDKHPVTIGDDLSLYLLDTLDYAAVHTYRPEEFSSYRSLGKPFIFQEVWNESGLSRENEALQAERLKKQFRAFLRTGARGFAPWQWTRQARLWDSASRTERWDDELGLCVREDGSLKPAGEVYSKLIGSISER